MKSKCIKTVMLPLLLIYCCVLLLSCSSDDDVDFIKVEYHILDKNGQEVNVINYGDEFILEVIVTNSTDQILKFKDVWYLLNGAYIVYNSEGQMFNPIPHNDLMMRPVTIEPGEQFRNGLIWPWTSVPLTKGKYYSTYTLNIDKMINKSYTITFEIK